MAAPVSPVRSLSQAEQMSALPDGLILQPTHGSRRAASVLCQCLESTQNRALDLRTCVSWRLAGLADVVAEPDPHRWSGAHESRSSRRASWARRLFSVVSGS